MTAGLVIAEEDMTEIYTRHHDQAAIQPAVSFCTLK